MKIISKNKCELTLEGTEDYLLSKSTMFNAKDFEGNLTINGFSGVASCDKTSLIHVAEWLDYSESELNQLKLLLDSFNLKSSGRSKCYLLDVERSDYDIKLCEDFPRKKK